MEPASPMRIAKPVSMSGASSKGPNLAICRSCSPPSSNSSSIYKWIGSVLDAAAKDPAVMKTLQATALAADQELIAPLMQWRYNGQPAGNGWTSPANNGAFGTDYLHRAGAVKADPYDNKRNETMYFYTDNDTQLRQDRKSTRLNSSHLGI